MTDLEARLTGVAPADRWMLTAEEGQNFLTLLGKLRQACGEAESFTDSRGTWVRIPAAIWDALLGAADPFNGHKEADPS